MKRELIRAKEEVKRIQSVPLVIGQFNEMVDANFGIASSTAGSIYFVRTQTRRVGARAGKREKETEKRDFLSNPIKLASTRVERVSARARARDGGRARGRTVSIVCRESLFPRARELGALFAKRRFSVALRTGAHPLDDRPREAQAERLGRAAPTLALCRRRESDRRRPPTADS